MDSSSSELLLHITKKSPFPSSKAILWSRNRRPAAEFISFRFSSRKNVDFTDSISMKFKEIRHPISSSSSSSFFPESEGNNESSSNEGIKTVQVKFQLIKDCLFGQDILVVGDDPIFGVWDPSNAIPLEWSDGHLWSLQLDIPINKSIHFKFILKEPTGEVIWQPGPDRLLTTWETDNTIVIFEDWDNVQLQMVTEEDSVAKSNTAEPTISPINTVEKLAYPEVEQTDKEDSLVIEKTSKSLKGEETSFQYEGEPILVPGLAPVSTTTVKGGLPQVFKNDIIVETPATTSNTNVVDVEVEAEDGYIPEKHENEDLNEITSDEEMITRMEFAYLTDDEQGTEVGIGKNCQSTDEVMEVLDIPSTDDVDILKPSLKSDDSFMRQLLISLGFIIDQMN